jgi:hypothetical protein
MTWLLAMVVCKQIIDNDKEMTLFAGCFYCHGDAAVGCRVHRLMEHIQGFTIRSRLSCRCCMSFVLKMNGSCCVLLVVGKCWNMSAQHVASMGLFCSFFKL